MHDGRREREKRNACRQIVNGKRVAQPLAEGLAEFGILLLRG